MTTAHREHIHTEACTYRPEPRCTITGHRTGRWGIPPEQTRELPARFWIFELISRIEARLRHRYQNPEG